MILVLFIHGGQFFNGVDYLIDRLKFRGQDGSCHQIVDEGLFFNIDLAIRFGFVSKQRLPFVTVIDYVQSLLEGDRLFILEVIQH